MRELAAEEIGSEIPAFTEKRLCTQTVRIVLMEKGFNADSQISALTDNLAIAESSLNTDKELGENLAKEIWEVEKA